MEKDLERTVKSSAEVDKYARALKSANVWGAFFYLSQRKAIESWGRQKKGGDGDFLGGIKKPVGK